ncbi:S1 family peptidase [Rubinisphaera italica]|uniref:Peptidase Do n=1 Tax=Rubinisphaera italica TaxID=2527969 RepID=A0A5C5XE71_9PLAN|nr:serine protease [Rubinisphaera italica]TWT60959.1 hypothetical protein Pan54_16910 [Rubinisphaera italica]
MINKLSKALAVCCVLVVSLTAADAQEAVSVMNESARHKLFIRSVIKISDRTDWKSGSGFIVREDDAGRKYAVTNAHVVEYGHELQIDVYPHGSVDARDGIEILARDEARDLALIRFRADGLVGFLPLASRHGRELRHDTATLVGFPDGELTLRKIDISSRNVRDGDYSGKFFYLDSRFGAGGSGSPIIGYDKHGLICVVGVYHGYSGDRGIGCFEVEEFLVEAKYRTLLDGKPSSNQKQAEIAQIIGLFLQSTMED